eukprot:gene6240-9560_t
MNVGEAWSDWQKRKVRVHYVRVGEWETITEAISHAASYDRIEVSQGTYHESLVISKEIELVNAEGESPDIAVRGTAITIVGTKTCFISGFEIFQNDRSREVASVVISEGTPVLTQCKFPSLLVNGYATPFLESNAITGSSLTSGVRIRGSAGGTFVGCQIEDHQLWCVEVSSRGVVLFDNNTIACVEPAARGKKRGKGAIHVASGPGDAQCTFVRNVITDAAASKSETQREIALDQRLEAKPDSPATSPTAGPGAQGQSAFSTTLRAAVVVDEMPPDLRFEDNTVMHCAIGLLLRGGSPVVAGNVFSKNSVCGLRVEGGSPVVAKNKFSECRAAAIVSCGPQAAPEITENTITGHSDAGHGISVNEGSPTVRRNVLHRVQKVSLKLHQCKGVYEENVVKEPHGPGVLVTGGEAAPRMVKNVVHGGSMQGFIVAQYAAGVYESNTVTKTRVGFAILEHAAPLVDRCYFCEIEGDGIVSANAGAGVVRQCKSEYCSVGISVAALGRTRFEGCTAVACRETGVLCSGPCAPVFESCVVKENRGSGFEVVHAGDPYCVNNTIERNLGCGVIVRDAGLGSFVENKIHDNSMANAVVCDPASVGNFRRNTFGPSESGEGLQVAAGGAARAEKNTFSALSVAAGAKDDGTTLLLRANWFTDVSVAACRFKQGSAGVASGNSVQESATGFCVAEGACPVLTRNVVENVTTAFRVAGIGSNPEISRNTITSAASYGVLVSGAGDPFISDNSISCCGVAALFVDGSNGRFEGNRLANNPVGVAAEARAEPRVSRNEVRNSSEAAVKLHLRGAGTFAGNTLTDSAVGVLVCGETGRAVVEGNAIRSNTHGVRVREDGRGKGGTLFRLNTVADSAVSNVLVELSGHAVFEENTISRGPVGVTARAKGRGVFRRNTISDHTAANVRITAGADPRFEANTIAGSPIGIEVFDHGKGIVEDNVFENNGLHLSVHSFGDPLVTKCSFIKSKSTGLVIGSAGKGVFRGNVFADHAVHGVEFAAKSCPIFEENDVSGNKVHGVYVSAEALGVVRRNVIQRNGGAGVYVEAAARVVIEDNRVFENGVGIECRAHLGGDERGGAIAGNEVAANRTAGIRVAAAPGADGGGELLEHNVVHDEEAGIVLAGGTDTRLAGNVVVRCSVGVLVQAGAAVAAEANFLYLNACGVRFE